MKPCPFCQEQIQDSAIKCRFCGEWLNRTKTPGSDNPKEVESRPSSANEKTRLTEIEFKQVSWQLGLGALLIWVGLSEWAHDGVLWYNPDWWHPKISPLIWFWGMSMVLVGFAAWFVPWADRRRWFLAGGFLKDVSNFAGNLAGNKAEILGKITLAILFFGHTAALFQQSQYWSSGKIDGVFFNHFGVSWTFYLLLFLAFFYLLGARPRGLLTRGPGRAFLSFVLMIVFEFASVLSLSWLPR